MNALWRGTLNFGLVNIPVSLYSGENKQELDFTLLDKRDKSPVGYRKVNKRTGEEVPPKEIVKGYEYSEGEYVIVTDEDFKRADVERSRTIEISSFVNAIEVDPSYYDRPYYLEPTAKSERAYALLRAALAHTHRVGIASMVMRARQHLCAVLARGPLLLLNLLRFHYELRDPSELKLPQADAREIGISEAEIRMAERLISDMSAPWRPERYRDEYRDELLSFIRRKAAADRALSRGSAASRRHWDAAGRVEEVEPLPRKPRRLEPPADIMALLKESVAQAETSRGRQAPARRGRYLH